LLDGNLRLRTACNFQVAVSTIAATYPEGFALPSLVDLESDLLKAIKACSGKMVQTTVKFKD